MKKSFLLLLLAISIMACQQKTDHNETSNNQNKADIQADTAAINKLLFEYRDALNASDASKAVTLYTQDGVFMPSSAPTSIGQEQVKGAYDFVFSNIKLNIEFSIDEVVVEGDYAFARTTSKGTTLIHASGETVPEENRELFVLQKVNGDWKIARYMFNKMK